MLEATAVDQRESAWILVGNPGGGIGRGIFLIGIFGTPYTASIAYRHVASTINPIDYTWLYPAFLLAPTFVVLMACIHHHASDSKKIFGQIGLSFALAYAAVITTSFSGL